MLISQYIERVLYIVLYTVPISSVILDVYSTASALTARTIGQRAGLRMKNITETWEIEEWHRAMHPPSHTVC